MSASAIRITDLPGDVRINPALFGCNMEPTRRTYWSGLSAQMLNNRKFYAQTGGEFRGWSSFGEVQCGYDTKKSVCRSFYPVLHDGQIQQDSEELLAQAGREYAFCCWVEADQAAVVTVSWGDAWQQQFVVTPCGKPQQLSATFSAAADGRQKFALAVEGRLSVYCVSLLPADNILGMRKDVMDALRDCRIAVLRFPGGCYAEAYSWKDGLLPVDFRPPVDSQLYNGDFLHRNTYGQECHEIGTDEFVYLCRYVGAQPCITVPLIEKDVQDAADWVEYCNTRDTRYGKLRTQRGFAEPYHVGTWFIGNELYYFGKALKKDGTAAGRREERFIQAMKAVDPTISAVAGFSPYCPEWSRDSLAVCDESADMLSHHYYFTNEFSSNWGKFSVEEALDVAAGFERDLADTVRLAQQITGRSWPVSIDEWGFDWGSRGHGLSVVVDALICHFMLNHAHEYAIQQAFYFHPVNEGVVKVEPSGVSLDIMGAAWHLLKEHSGNRLCKAQTDDEMISVAVSRSGDWLIATVVNRDARLPHEVFFDTPMRGAEWIRVVPQEVSAQNSAFTTEKTNDFSGSLMLEAGSVSLFRFRL